MGWQVTLLLILALAAGIVGAIDRIFPDEEDVRKRRKKRIIGFATIAVLAASLLVQGFNHYRTTENERALKEYVDNVFSDVPGASGGVVVDGFAYLVDDDKPVLFKAKFNDAKYSSDTTEIKLYDKEFTDNDRQEDHLLTKKEVDDLEGAAYFKGKIYLITSHSDNRLGYVKEERQRFLEVELKKVKTKDDAELEIGVVTRWANLRPAIMQVLFPTQGEAIAEPFVDTVELNAKKGIKTVMEIEGLAIDESGNVYLGFRGPQKRDDSHALLLRTNLKQIFTDGEDWTPKKKEGARKPFPKFEVCDVFLGGSRDDPYGIVDLVYYDNSLLILTNSALKFIPTSKTPLAPGLWQWPIKDIRTNPASLRSKSFFSPPSKILAKPEVLLPPNKVAPNKIFMFLDAEGFGGGQRSYEKTQLRLAS